MYRKGVGVPALATYLQEANKEVEVWLQVCSTVDTCTRMHTRQLQVHVFCLPLWECFCCRPSQENRLLTHMNGDSGGVGQLPAAILIALLD